MPRQDSEPPMAVASRWVHEITGIALQMALPAGLGAWADGRWGTSPWLVSIGACLGMFVAMTSLVRLSQRENEKNKRLPSQPDSVRTEAKNPSAVQDSNQQHNSDQQS